MIGSTASANRSVLADMTPLAGWQNFYVIIGSAGGALIGLQFVVMSLIVGGPTRVDPEAGHAFATPNIVHFAAVLGLSGILCAPWEGMGGVEVLWGLLGMSGIVYGLVVMRRMRVQTAYKPVFEDWAFYLVLPFLAYVTLAVCAFTAGSHPRESLFGVGGAALLLLFIGIHNAWDAVTYHIFEKNLEQK